jgi:hypothetical protein
MEQETNRPGESVSFILGLATGIAASVTGFLYSVGGVLLAGQLRPTGVPARDILPLIPLSQMLGRGLSVLLGDLGISLIALFALSASFLGGMWMDRLHQRAKEREARAQRALDETEEVLRANEASITPKERLDELEASVRGMHANDEEKEELLAQLANTRNLSADARMATGIARSLIAENRTLIPVAKPGMAPGLIRTLSLAFNGVSTLFLIAVSDPVVAPFIALTFGAYLLSALGRIRWAIGLTAFWAALWVGYLVSAYYYPQPLPTTTLITKDDSVVKGNLLLQSGGRFYVNDTKARYRAVSDTDIRSAYVQANPNRSRPQTYRIVLDWF